MGVVEEYPTEYIPGTRVWRNSGNGFLSVLLHYSADPDTADAAARKSGMTIEDYEREHNLSFSSYAGKPAFPEWKPDFVTDSLPLNPELPIWRGWDFGYHRPAVVWAQLHGGLYVHGEVMGEGMTLQRFIDECVFPYQERIFPEGVTYIDAADPAGKQVSDKSDHTSFTILSNRGIFPLAKKTEIKEGLTLIRNSMVADKFRSHERCKILNAGDAGGYRYPEATKGNPNPELPLKDGYFDHLQDARRYIVVNSMSLYLTKKKEKRELTREDKLYAKLRGTKGRDRDLGDYA